MFQLVGLYAIWVKIIKPELPYRKDEAELATIEKRLRRAVELRSLTDGFMPMSAYDDLREEFLKNRSDYFSKRDEIVQKWSALTTDFEFGLDEMLKFFHSRSEPNFSIWTMEELRMDAPFSYCRIAATSLLQPCPIRFSIDRRAV